MKKLRVKNLFLIIILVVIIFASQFILARKQIEYGFYNDDWYVLGWYKQVVKNPILDIPKAWEEIGPHNFVHAYYMGLMHQLFELNYSYYHILNTLLKAIAILSLFPVVYLLFKNRPLAFIATFVFAFHPSSFGVIYHVIGGEGSLVVIGMNLFLTTYIYASKKHLLNDIKILILLLTLFLATSFFEVTRAYPLILFLPLLEIINFFFNRKSTSTKFAFLRLLFLYFPFIALVIYHPSALVEINFNKFIRTFAWGNLQLLLTIFGSYGSTFIPEGLIDQLNKFAKGAEGVILYKNFTTFLNFLILKFSLTVIPVLIIIKSVVGLNRRWVLRCLLLIYGFSIIAFWLSNHWLNLDSKLRAPVDPGVYFIPALIGLFIFACSISFFVSWVESKDRNNFLLALSVTAVFSLLYTFLTWILVDDNAIFMGVHAYLNVAAVGSSLFLGCLFYLALEKLRFGFAVLKQSAACLILLYFFLFSILSAFQIDKFFSYWLKTGFAASDQQRLHKSFWKEVGLGKSKDEDPVLIYLDDSQDKENEYFYANSIIWSIPAMLTVEKGLPFDPGGYCKSVVSYKNADKLRIGIINDKKMIVQNSCGPDLFYKPENFFAFRMMNRDLIPIKSEILKKLEDE